MSALDFNLVQQKLGNLAIGQVLATPTGLDNASGVSLNQGDQARLEPWPGIRVWVRVCGGVSSVDVAGIYATDYSSATIHGYPFGEALLSRSEREQHLRSLARQKENAFCGFGWFSQIHDVIDIVCLESGKLSAPVVELGGEASAVLCELIRGKARGG
jgi:hypothetical protein